METCSNTAAMTTSPCPHLNSSCSFLMYYFLVMYSVTFVFNRWALLSPSPLPPKTSTSRVMTLEGCLKPSKKRRTHRWSFKPASWTDGKTFGKHSSYWGTLLVVCFLQWLHTKGGCVDIKACREKKSFSKGLLLIIVCTLASMILNLCFSPFVEQRFLILVIH